MVLLSESLLSQLITISGLEESESFGFCESSFDCGISSAFSGDDFIDSSIVVEFSADFED